MAKATYVWLDQLSRRYERDIHTLDAIPDEELDRLRRLGRDRPLADRPVGALAGIGDDQAATRQPGCGRLGLFARRLPDRRRHRRRGRLREPPRPGLGPRHPPGQRHGAQSHGHRLALGDRASGVVPVGRGSALPRVHLQRTRSLAGRTGLDRPRGPLLGQQRRRGRLQAPRSRLGREPLHLPRQRRDELSLERHRPARLHQGRGPRAGHPDDPGRRAALPRDPLRRGDGPRPEARRAALVAAAGRRRRHPLARRARNAQGRIRPPDADRVLAGRRRPGCRRGPQHAPARRGVLAPRGLLRPNPGHASRLQQRLHAHAPRRGQRRLPAGDPRDAGVRSRDPQALRELHEQPRRGDRTRAVRIRATSTSALPRCS